MTGQVKSVPHVNATIPRDRVPPGAQYCQTEDFAFGGEVDRLVVRELTGIEFADWQHASESSGASPMHQQIDFVGRCLCDEHLSPVGATFAGQLPRTVMQRAAEVALRLNGLAGDDGGEKKA